MRKTLTVSVLALTLATAGAAFGQAQDDAATSGPMQQVHWRGGHEDGWRQGRQGRGWEMRGGRDRGDMMRRMQAFDLNQDGAITQVEIDQFRQGQLTRFDADRDGTLSLDEYQALWLDQMRERMVDAFQEHDDDGDGQVTAEEFNERFAGLVERLDRNGDGQLSPDDRGGNRRAGPRQEPAAPEGETTPQP